jgi:glycosyltransferase involved in cell wall biosynthesis
VHTAGSLRILHLISQRPDSTGSGTYVRAMLREADACHHRNFLVAGIQADRSAAVPGLAPNQCVFVKFLHGDISYPIVGMSDVMPYQSRTFASLSPEELREYEAAFAKALCGAVTRFKPHVIHTHHLWIMSSLARDLFPRIPMVATCHGSDLRQFHQCPHLRERVLRGCRRLDAVMALSEAQKADIVRLFGLTPTRVVVVGAGYDGALFAAGPKPTPNPVQLIYAGKLSRSKGVPSLLRALARIDAPAWQLHLVGGGGGDEGEHCLDLATGLGNRVRVHGPLEHEGVAALMKQCHILALPSFYEGLGLVALEGLASGCRLVATSLPGIGEMLRDVRADFISLVKPPRMRLPDQPYDEEEPGFEADLAAALRTQMAAAALKPDIDLTPVRDALAAWSWAGTFARVQSVYSRVLGA